MIARAGTCGPRHTITAARATAPISLGSWSLTKSYVFTIKLALDSLFDASSFAYAFTSTLRNTSHRREGSFRMHALPTLLETALCRFAAVERCETAKVMLDATNEIRMLVCYGQPSSYITKVLYATLSANYPLLLDQCDIFV